MKKLLHILLALALMAALALSVAAAEEPLPDHATPTMSAYAYQMTYYENGYGAMPNRYQCTLETPDGSFSEWFTISYGDPLVEQWPAEAGAHTVTFQVTQTVGGTSCPFTVTMEISVLPLPETSGRCGENMTWEFDTETDTLTLSGTGDMFPIAATLQDYWDGNYSYEPGWWYLPVRHILVEEGVEHLSDFAFFQPFNNYYEIHETLSLPTTLKAIPELGFLASTAMESLTIPEGITSLTGWPFGSPGNSFTGVRELHLPSTLQQMDVFTLLIAGLDNKTAAQTLETIFFAGTESQWDAIARVDSECFKTLYGDDYEGFYENWCKPAAEVIENIHVVFLKEDMPFDISIHSPITMSQIYGTLLRHEGIDQIVYLDWSYNGLVDATVAGKTYTGITTGALASLIREAYPNDIVAVEWQEGTNQIGTPWSVGEPNDCSLVLRILNQEDIPIPCQVLITETDIASVAASPVTYYDFEGWVAPEFTVTYADGTTGPLPEGILITYPDGMPSTPGTHTVKILVGCILETEAQVTVLATPTEGQLGEDITWTYDGESDKLTLTGTGSTFQTLEDTWQQLLLQLGPREVVVEEGIEGLTAGIFHYGLSIEKLTLPTTLKTIPDALIGWNGMDGQVLDGYVCHTMSSIVIPEGITSLTSSAFYLCCGIQDFYLPSTLEELDLDTLCYSAYCRVQTGLAPIKTTIHYPGTEEQWAQIKQVAGSRLYATGLTDDELAELFATFDLVFEPPITLEDTTATVPDHLVTLPEEGAPTVDVTELPADSILLAPETVGRLHQAQTGLELKLPVANLTFDSAAFGVIGALAAEKKVTFVARETAPENLTEAQQAALENTSAARILTLEALAGDEKISQFGEGKVCVSIPFQVPADKTGSDFYVAYLAEDGTATELPTEYTEEGCLTFTTDHFSTYVVLEKVPEPPVTEPPVTEPPATEPPVTEPPVNDNPDTGDARLTLLMLLLYAGTAAMVFLTRRRCF